MGQTPCFVFWATFPVILLTQWLSFIISSQLINECPRDERIGVLASALCLVQTERLISTLLSFTRPYTSSGHWLLLPHCLTLNQPQHHLGRRSSKSCPSFYTWDHGTCRELTYSVCNFQAITVPLAVNSFVITKNCYLSAPFRAHHF